MKTHHYSASFVTQKLTSSFKKSVFYRLLLLTVLTLGHLVVIYKSAQI